MGRLTESKHENSKVRSLVFASPQAVMNSVSPTQNSLCAPCIECCNCDGLTAMPTPLPPAAAFPEARRGNAWDDWEEVSEVCLPEHSLYARADARGFAGLHTRRATAGGQCQAMAASVESFLLLSFRTSWLTRPVEQQRIPTDLLDTAICVECDSATSGGCTFRCDDKRSARLEDPKTTDRGFYCDRQCESIREQRRSSAD